METDTARSDDLERAADALLTGLLGPGGGLGERERSLIERMVGNGNGNGAADAVDAAVRERVLDAVGASLVEQTLAVLGRAMALRLLENERPELAMRLRSAADEKQPMLSPSPRPTPPAPPPSPREGDERQPMLSPSPRPTPPAPPPSPRATMALGARSRQATAIAPATPAPFVILDEVLVAQELEALTAFTLEREARFRHSEVIAPDATDGEIDFDHRRSRILYDLEEHHRTIADALLAHLDYLFAELGVPWFEVQDIEAQITASHDGGFFAPHMDNGHDVLDGRVVTFVYFFHAEPKRFTGGELRIYDGTSANGNGNGHGPAETFKTIVPQQNQAVLFPSHVMHEVTMVRASSSEFGASRFTLNGWLRR